MPDVAPMNLLVAAIVAGGVIAGVSLRSSSVSSLSWSAVALVAAAAGYIFHLVFQFEHWHPRFYFTLSEHTGFVEATFLGIGLGAVGHAIVAIVRPMLGRSGTHQPEHLDINESRAPSWLLP